MLISAKKVDSVGFERLAVPSAASNSLKSQEGSQAAGNLAYTLACKSAAKATCSC